MSRQYNMYNVQLSEFWKQRVGKETMHNAPNMFGDEDYPDDLVSEAPSRASGYSRSQVSVASTATRQKASPRSSFTTTRFLRNVAMLRPHAALRRRLRS